MNITLDGLIGKGVIVYMDDLILYSDTLEKHEQIFNTLMDRLRKANWKLEPKKCVILKRQVTYLGHILSEEVVKPDLKNLEAVKDFPRPKTPKDIKCFLGLVGYYRRYIRSIR